MNRLAGESSPYLRQHADNPVDWYPWGEAAFDEARSSDRPLLLSVGYSACHWCHVMAHESFEDADTAEVMNNRFVNVKVDREERPDVDAIYMDAVTALTGRGGWPMTVFLDHEGRPFHAGTYWPDRPRGGMPSFTQVLEAVDEAVAEVSRVLDDAGRFAFFLNHPLIQTPGSGWVDDHLMDPPEQYWRIGPYLTESIESEEVDRDVFLPFVHRPVSRYVNALADHGLVLRRMHEPRPAEGFLVRATAYPDADTVPRLLVLVAEREPRQAP